MLKARKSPPTMDFAVPAINIVFLLLLFFITSGSQVNRPELSVAPPTAELLPGDRLPRPLLTVMPEGALFLDGEAIEEADLLSTIAARRLADPSAFATLNIMADRTFSARDLLTLMDRLRGDTGMALKIVTRREIASRAAP
ncbi:MULTISPECIES: ExbD/TolR family protein [unclassified Aureimonas]|uniref:ExbD/TolR family protein n=1 Tax=unclassified Aureimonas TaxID=2615206 RepID=UPI0006F28776|nr:MULTISPECIES: biopolymer transporter ExbD [unclassified Aureimonas]KQT57503.1 hypothetical protein ASG62_09325 [Aureimonas sp. Leaf427]KQT77183.1 hypothetical protein ASG54_13195 [Aureimonas sp. Leaf460]